VRPTARGRMLCTQQTADGLLGYGRGPSNRGDPRRLKAPLGCGPSTNSGYHLLRGTPWNGHRPRLPPQERGLKAGLRPHPPKIFRPHGRPERKGKGGREEGKGREKRGGRKERGEAKGRCGPQMEGLPGADQRQVPYYTRLNTAGCRHPAG
jgi:hypothetical protein